MDQYLDVNLLSRSVHTLRLSLNKKHIQLESTQRVHTSAEDFRVFYSWLSAGIEIVNKESVKKTPGYGTPTIISGLLWLGPHANPPKNFIKIRS